MLCILFLILPLKPSEHISFTSHLSADGPDGKSSVVTRARAPCWAGLLLSYLPVSPTSQKQPGFIFSKSALAFCWNSLPCDKKGSPCQSPSEFNINTLYI